MRDLNFLIKPSSSLCNMECKYCFYMDVAEKRTEYEYGFMVKETLENIIRKGIEEVSGTCSFTFQGGEPTLAGIGFYKKAVDIQKKYQNKRIEVYNAIQTNGYLIDEEWASFLGENHFLVGLSLDGTAELHNENRKDKSGKGTWSRVMRAVRLFRKYKVSFNILCVVTGKTAACADKVYNFFIKNGFYWLQFIPCMEPLYEERGSEKYSLGPEAYGKFLIRIFDRWLNDLKNGKYISIRTFDNWISMVLGEQPEACNMAGKCSVQFVVESDGSIYPCDFYVIDKWRIGNINKDEITDIVRSVKAEAFIAESGNISCECRKCRWFVLCKGGCKRDRLFDENAGYGINYYCKAYKKLFEEREKEIELAGNIILQMRKRLLR